MKGRAKQPPVASEFSTLALLAAKYGGRPIIPLDEVRADFFGHLNPEVFARKLCNGEIRLPVMRIGGSQKSPRSVSLRALAAYIDERARLAEEVIKAPGGR